MLHEKMFHDNKKKLMLHKKGFSCRQKQDDAAQKKYFFPERWAVSNTKVREK